jgi:hypothetical protein
MELADVNKQLKRMREMHGLLDELEGGKEAYDAWFNVAYPENVEGIWNRK